MAARISSTRCQARPVELLVADPTYVDLDVECRALRGGIGQQHGDSGITHGVHIADLGPGEAEFRHLQRLLGDGQRNLGRFLQRHLHLSRPAAAFCCSVSRGSFIASDTAP